MARSRRSAPARPAPRPVAASRPAPPPAPTQHAAPPAPQQQSGGGIGGMMGGMMGMVGQGLAFGTGSAVAHRAVDSVMGPRTLVHEHSGAPEAAAPTSAAAPVAPSGDACTYQTKAFQDCVTEFGSDISKCQFYIDMLNDCKRNSTSAATL